MRKLILLSVICLNLFGGPFGLEKGMKLHQIDKKAKKISENYYEVNVPKPNSDFESYKVIVDPKLGLLKVVAIGKTVRANDFGDQLRNEFERYENKLIISYGKNKKFDFLKAESIWDDSRYFMMGLYKEERYLSAYWSEEYGSTLKDSINIISLQADALNTSEGYLRLGYQFDGFKEYSESQANKPDDTL